MISETDQFGNKVERAIIGVRSGAPVYAATCFPALRCCSLHGAFEADAATMMQSASASPATPDPI